MGRLGRKGLVVGTNIKGKYLFPKRVHWPTFVRVSTDVNDGAEFALGVRWIKVGESHENFVLVDSFNHRT